jgi:hypothetical protein
MDYKVKYLKYKSKYLKLKNQLGGIGDTFYIYTTGIAEWGDLSQSLKSWNETLCKQVCDLIPRKFKNIFIIHSDILQSIAKEKIDETYANILNKIQHDLEIDSRIKDSTFQTEPLDFANISGQTDPYIIIDIAHLFEYIRDNYSSVNVTRAFIKGSYGEPRGDVITLNVVYPGYKGGYLNNTPFFRVNEDNSVTTYINKLLDNSRFSDFDLYNPNLKIEELFNQIRKKLYDKIRKKYGSLKNYDDQRDHIEAEIKKKSVNLIMNTNMIESVLIDNVADDVMITFFPH